MQAKSPRRSVTASGSPLRVAMRLQEIGRNRLSAEDVAMFKMFERERWTPEQRRTYILAEAGDVAAE
jgi:hypothetical protein